MYRLMKLRAFGASHVNGATWGPRPSSRTCRMCNGIQANSIASRDFVRWQSTHTNPSVVTKKPRKKRPKYTKKNYAEMLVVTNYSTSECRARVQNLRPDDIRMLALTNFKLNELYKLKEFMRTADTVREHTYHNLADVNNLPNVEGVDETFTTVIDRDVADGIRVESAALERNDEAVELSEADVDAADVETNLMELTEVFEKAKLKSALAPEVIEEEVEVEVEEPAEVEVLEPAVVKKKQRPIDRTAREQMCSQTLSAYIEVCVNQKKPQKALNAYYLYRNRCNKMPDRYPPLKSVRVYNALLRGFAARGDHAKVHEVLRHVQEADVKLDAHSYAAIFECLARYDGADRRRLIGAYAERAQLDGITFNHVMNRATFLFDQRDRVLEAMRVHEKEYTPVYEKPSVQFKNHLVDRLNNEEQLRGFPEDGKGEKGIFRAKTFRDWVHKQMEVEKHVYVTVKSIETKSEPTEEVLKYREAWSDHLKLWEEAATKAFDRDLKALSAQRGALNMEPYLRCIPMRDYVTIIVDEAKKIAQGSETYSPTVNMLYRDLGAKVYAKYQMLLKQRSGVLDKIHAIHNKYCDNYAKSHTKLDVLPDGPNVLNPRQKWQWAEYSFRHDGASIATDHRPWVPFALQGIGKFLYNIVMHDLKVDVNVMRLNRKNVNHLPAFYTIFRNQGRVIKEEVKPHPVLSKLYRASSPETLTFPAYDIPMRCPPVPWTSVANGGYLIAPTDIVRLPSQATMQKEQMTGADPNDLYPTFDALNQLASVPWKVNTRILDVILEVFQKGGSSKLDVPEPPSALPPPPSVTSDMEKAQRVAVFRQKLFYKRKRAEMYSMWCDCLYRLSLAEHFRDDIFWLPHNMDFRGRVYPIPPHLNHLGSDLARSMLIFAEARPLGLDGLEWLKLHLVNLTGLKKHDRVEDRSIYANSIMHEVLDSADRPLTGRMWWAKSEEPWQTLACCMEIANAVRSPDPERFLSHFPVHQDGSCNGLQHYAALGRDSAGAFSVNLTPAPKPQDVYSAVAALVEERRQKDAEAGIEIAKTLEGFVRRKTIKQTVMTTVYGVTRFGARLQIARQLKDLEEFPKESVWAGSSYLTARTFESLRSMFTSTREIQDWFTECARLISSVCGKNVEWVTPLGLPIVQPYFRYKKSTSSTKGFDSFQTDKFEKPNVMKQKNAFAPNFVHSLDSSHMMLTSLYSERAGITFVSVHDCYWTHPSTVHIMNKICREQFVALHSEPILEDLSNFFSEKYMFELSPTASGTDSSELMKLKLNRVIRKLPTTGTFNIDSVLDSIYFFS